MKTALENLIVLLKDENTISPYEMCSSGLVQALLTVLNNVSLLKSWRCSEKSTVYFKNEQFTINRCSSGVNKRSFSLT